MDFENNYIPPVKLNKHNQNDIYCFQCHHEGDVINCDSCPRVYHSKCLSLTISPERNWTCPECEVMQSSFNIINQRYSINELNIMLKHVLHQLKSHPKIQLFQNSIDLKQKSDYSDYIIHPMDFEIIEKNLNLKKYSSTGSFINDIKWILHNTYIYNGNQSKLTHIARIILKKAQYEMSEIEICPECYLRSIQSITTDWFIKPCSIPHVLCWAKMKGYQTWPAKVLRIINDDVDVRFFGKHDRARISHNNCWILSQEYPGREKKSKSNINLDKSLAELQRHIDQLKKLYGYFNYAPSQTLLSKIKPFKFVSIIDDSILPCYMTAGNNSSIFHSKQHRSKTTAKRSNENEQSVKRLRIDEEQQSILNVFDIFNDHEISFKFRPISPTDNKYQIQGLLRRYTNIEPFNPDVISSMNGLLDAVENISEIHTNISNQISEQQCSKRKKPRKSNSQHRILPENSISQFLPCLSLDRFLSSTLPFVPLRPLSVSPPSMEIFQATPTDDNIQQFSLKSEEESQSITQSSISINSFLIPSTIDETIPLPTIIPCIPPIPEENIWPSILSIDDPPRKQSNKNKNRRLLRPSIDNQSYLSSTSDQNSIQIPLNEHQIRDEIQMTINNFNNQFQQLLVDLTSQIDSSIHKTRMKYERDLEEIRHSYRVSLNDLQTIATEQVQEIHNSLELQYWKRLSEMRNRYESKLHYS